MINNNFLKYFVPIIIIISGLLILNFDNFKQFYNEPTWEQVGFRRCIKNNHLNSREHTHIITKLQFNSNTNNIDEFIKDNGFILHLTTFNGKWQEKNLNHILKFKKKMNI